nr:calcium-binding protein [Kistimonas asteriae]
MTGATFTDEGQGKGVFQWFPEVGQAGVYKLIFTATDGELDASEEVALTVNPADDKDGDGLNDEWEQTYFNSLERDGSGDYDNDGYSDFVEFDSGTDPTVKQVAPGVPDINAPLPGREVVTLTPVLGITNSVHGSGELVTYAFEVYRDESMTDLLASVDGVAETSSVTEWIVTEDAIVEGKAIADNTQYWWRVRASNGLASSEWASSTFFINRENDAPVAFSISEPEHLSVVDTLTPTLAVNNSFDVDGDLLTYSFKLFNESDSDFETPVAFIDGLAQGDNGSTAWQVPDALEENGTYLWLAIATDEHGATASSEPAAFLVSTVNDAPSIPDLVSPQDGGELRILDNQSVVVGNAVDPEKATLTYTFELDTVNTFDSEHWQVFDNVQEGTGHTSITLPALQDNTQYYWRAKASDGMSASNWIQGRFFANTANDAPAVPTIANPAASAWVEILQPSLVLNPSIDLDGDTLRYAFELVDTGEPPTLLAQGVKDSPVFPVEFDLADNAWYLWRARAIDEHGEASDWTEYSRFFVNRDGIDDVPRFTFVEPAADLRVTGGQVDIRWTDSDPDSSAVIRLFANGELITPAQEGALQEDEDGEADSFLWDLSGVESGDYQLSAEIRDDESSIVIESPYTITLLPPRGSVSVRAMDGYELEETGVSVQSFGIRLDDEVQDGASVTFNFSLSNPEEAAILGDKHYLQFTHGNWDREQVIQVKGMDDCVVDGNQRVGVVFQPGVSDDPRYSEMAIDTIALTNADNEQPGQQLFVCSYSIEEQLSGSDGRLTTRFRARLDNNQEPLSSASAQLTVLGSDMVLMGGGSVSFPRVPYGTSVFSHETLAVQHSAESGWDPAKLQWLIQAGAPEAAKDGNNSNNTLLGGLGRDVINGHDGDDYIDGLAGDDIINGGRGADTLRGDLGDDTFVITGSDSHADKVNGGIGYDRVLGGVSDDVFRFQTFAGLDRVEEITGGAGRNVIEGTQGNDTLDFSHTLLQQISHINGLAGDDTLRGSRQADNIIGGPGSDSLYGNGGDDSFLFFANATGSDRVNGGDGFDRILGSASDDRIRLRQFENDFTVEKIDGLAGVNILSGDGNANVLDFRNTVLTGISLIDGEAGDDVIYGSNGRDVIRGGTGHDKVYGHGGDDRFLISGESNDTEYFHGGEGRDVIVGSPLNDKLRFDSFGPSNSIEEIDGDGGYNWLAGTGGNNTLDFSQTLLRGINRIKGGSGNDTIIGSAEADRIDGGPGTDAVYGGAGNDIIEIANNDGNHEIVNGGAGIDTLLGTDGNDDFLLSAFGGENSVEVIDGLIGYDSVQGNGAPNRLDFSGTRLRNIALVDGRGGGDTVIGSDQQDVLAGGSGHDRLEGRNGGDTYLFRSGDFKIDIADAGSSQDVDTVRITHNTEPRKIWIIRDGNDLKIYILGTLERIAVVNWFSQPASHRIERIEAGGFYITADQVQAFVDLMTPHGKPVLGAKIVLGGDRARIDSLIASSWTAY